ncbi:putative protein OS=Streptomyces fumanus OX=67302 GN=GCM10018772_05520 PE=4 SV=1 [Streptomyces fumanus]
MSQDRPDSWPKLLARHLIEEDLEESRRRTTRSGSLDRLLRWLREKFSSRVQEPAASRSDQAGYPSYETGFRSPVPEGSVHQAPRGNGAPLTWASDMPVRQALADLDVPKLQEVLHAALEQIAESKELREAYGKGKLPVVEWLLKKTAPQNTVAENREFDDAATLVGSERDNDDAATLVGSERDNDDAATLADSEWYNDDAATLAGHEQGGYDATTSVGLDQDGYYVVPMGDVQPQDLHHRNPWYQGPATEQDANRSASLPDEGRRTAAAETLPASPTAAPGARSAPQNPVTDRGALTTTVTVRQTSGAQSAGTGRAATPQTAPSVRSRGRR